MNHALVIGGTGMLADVSVWLVNHGYHVSVIARHAERMEELIKRTGAKNHITPLFVDYTDKKKLQEKIKHTLIQNGSIDLVVAWIHSVGEKALPIIAREISEHQYPWELFHILSSSTNLEAIKRQVSIPEFCIYHQIQLGFKIDGTHSRWLTHREIADGVISAIQNKEKIHIVGQIEPWEKRP